MKDTKKINLFSKETQEKYGHALYSDYGGHHAILRCDGKGGYLWWNEGLTKKAKKAISDELKMVFREQVMCIPNAEHPEYRVITKVYWDQHGSLLYDYDRVIIDEGIAVSHHIGANAEPDETANVTWKAILEAETINHMRKLWRRFNFVCSSIKTK